jgi:hypothetical protein
MNGLTLFGLAAVAAMLVFYVLESRSPAFVLAFALACVAASVYGFLQGAWPFGAVEAVWSLIAAKRWWLARKAVPVAGRLGGAARSSHDPARSEGNGDL